MKIDLTKFQIPSIDSWKNQVWKEANSDEALIYTNPIENIRIDISSKDNQNAFASASAKGDWDVCSAFKIDDSFENNEMILKCLELAQITYTSKYSIKIQIGSKYLRTYL